MEQATNQNEPVKMTKVVEPGDIFHVYLDQKDILILFSGGDETIRPTSYPFLSERTRIVYSKRYLFLDDTIEEIRAKVYDELIRVNIRVSQEKIYMVTSIEQNHDMGILFEDLAGSLSGTIGKNLYQQIAKNLGNSRERIYDKEDRIGWSIFRKIETSEMLVPLGYHVQRPAYEKAHASTYSLIFPVIPIDISYRDDRMKLEPRMRSTLLSVGVLRRALITVFLDEEASSDSDSWIKETYFQSEGVLDEDAVQSVLKRNDAIMPFYKEPQSKSLESGIVNMVFEIKNETDVRIPLEVIFNEIHAMKSMPVIKQNDTNSKVRLYSIQTTAEGKQIPETSMVEINTFVRDYTQDLAVLLVSSEHHLVVVIKQEGMMEVHYKVRLTRVQRALNLHDLDLFIRKNVNGMIRTVNEAILETGFEFPEITSLDDERCINIKKMDTRIMAPITFHSSIQVESLKPLCSIVDDKIVQNNEAILMFRRVSNYNILKEVRQRIRILTDLSPNERNRRFQEVREQYQLPQDVLKEIVEEEWGNEEGNQLRRRKRKHKEPGIICRITKALGNQKLIIDLEDIPSIQYIPLLSLYFQSFLSWVKTGRFPTSDVSFDYVPSLTYLNGSIENEDLEEELELEEEELEEEDELEEEQEVEEIKPVSEESYDSIQFNDSIHSNELNESIELNEDKADLKDIKIPGRDDYDSIEFSPTEDELEMEDADNEEPVNDATVNEPTIIENESPEINTQPPVGIPEQDSNESINIVDSNESINIVDSNDSINIVDSNESKDKSYDSIEFSPTESEQSYGGSQSRQRRNTTSMLNRLQTRDDLYKEENYAKACQKENQPVILTEEEKAEIDEQDKVNGEKSYEESMEYRGNQYICPGYWNFNEARSMTWKEIEMKGLQKYVMKTGNFEKEMKGDPKNNIPGRYIYQFVGTANKPRTKLFPGFTKATSKDGFCYPCCYETKGEAFQKKIQECQKKGSVFPIQEEKEANVEDEANNDSEFKIQGDDEVSDLYYQGSSEFIKAETVYPLDPGRFGFLPRLLIDAMYISNPLTLSVMPIDRRSHFLRFGLEKVVNQSFLACFADIYTAAQDLYRSKGSASSLARGLTQGSSQGLTRGSTQGLTRGSTQGLTGSVTQGPMRGGSIGIKTNRGQIQSSKVLPVRGFKDLLAKKITLDKFVYYQNGSLPGLFRPKQTIPVRYESYVETLFAKSLDLKDPLQESFFKETVDSYENFRAFLRNDHAVIDHNFLWDCISKADIDIIPEGLNLIILNVSEDDELHVLCPPNVFSLEAQFDPTKRSVILLRRKKGSEMVYEPIYKVSRVNNKAYSLERFFMMSHDGLQVFLKRVEEFLKQCSRTNEAPLYPYSRSSLLSLFQKESIQVVNQVIQNHACIGFQILKEELGSLFIPCIRSSPDSKIPKIGVKERQTYALDYKKTKEGLSKFARILPGMALQRKIASRANQKVVGFLLKNQLYVPIFPQVSIESTLTDKIGLTFSMDYFDADAQIFSDKVDIKRFQANLYLLESNFYRLFVLQLRKYLNDKANFEIRNDLVEQVENLDSPFQEKQKQVVELLKRATQNTTLFQDIDPASVQHLTEIHSCQQLGPSNPTDKSVQLCIRSQDGTSRFVFPRFNLVDRSIKNETVYFQRFAGELIKNPRIRNMILQSKYLFYRGTDTGLKKNEDEIILLESEIRSYLIK